jgi:hypothetical protein
MDAGLNISLEGCHSAGTIPCFGGAQHPKNGVNRGIFSADILEQLVAADPFISAFCQSTMKAYFKK